MPKNNISNLIRLNEQLPGPISLSAASNIYNNTERTLFVGIIVDALNYFHDYEVSVSKGANIHCTYTGTGNPSQLGVRDHTMLQPGQMVVVYVPPSGKFGYILCPIPQQVGSVAYNKSDWLMLQDAVTHREKLPNSLQIDVASEIRNFNNSRPRDVFPGDYGVMGPLGVGFNVSPTSIISRASDICNISMFYLDHMLRLHGHNYQLWTSAGEFYAGEDEGENFEIKRSSLYPWEMKGMPTQSSFADESNKEKRQTEQGADPLWEPDQTKARLEPLEVDQDLIPRLTEFGGYLGDLVRSIISCPPKDLVSQNKPERLSNKTEYTGLSEFTRHSNGLVEIRSTKGITLEKSVYIPVPKQISTPEDPAGDNSTDDNYTFAGKHGSDVHDKTEYKANDDPAAQIATLFDELSWNRNKAGLVSLTKHKKDWYISKEENSDLYADSHLSANSHKPFGSSFLAEMPKIVELEIDHRQGHSHKYYKARSIVQLRDNGDIIIENGHGSAIELVNGNIKITCPGDIILNNGRNLHVLAPNDINLRAGHAVDVSAAKSDVRIKAEKNLHMLAGNSGTTGGVLIESRSNGNKQEFSGKSGTAVNSFGVTIKSEGSPVNLIGLDCYLRSVSSGSIYIDADSGLGTCQIYANQLLEYVDNAKVTMVGVRPGQNTRASNVMQLDRGSLFAGKSLLVDGQLSATGQISSSSGVIASAGYFGGGDFEQSGPRFTNSIRRMRSSISDAFTGLRTSYTDLPTSGSAPYSDSNNIAEDYKTYGFSFRTSDQYDLEFGESMLLYESRWQQLYRLNNTDAEVWDEPVVESPDGVKTMPFPGYQNWAESKLFGTADLHYWDFKAGDLVDFPDELFEAEQTINKTVFKDSYLINHQGSK